MILGQAGSELQPEMQRPLVIAPIPLSSHESVGASSAASCLLLCTSYARQSPSDLRSLAPGAAAPRSSLAQASSRSRPPGSARPRRQHLGRRQQHGARWSAGAPHSGVQPDRQQAHLVAGGKTVCSMLLGEGGAGREGWQASQRERTGRQAAATGASPRLTSPLPLPFHIPCASLSLQSRFHFR